MKRQNLTEQQIIYFAAIKPWLRIFTAVFSILILSVNLAAIRDGGHSFFAIGISFIILYASLYDNSWIFNLNKKTAVQKKGLIFFCKTRTINFCEIHSIEIENFNKPVKIGSYTEIKLILADGEKIIIEKDKTKNIQYQIEAAGLIQKVIKAEAEKAAADFLNSVAAGILEK